MEDPAGFLLRGLMVFSQEGRSGVTVCASRNPKFQGIRQNGVTAAQAAVQKSEVNWIKRDCCLRRNDTLHHSAEVLHFLFLFPVASFRQRGSPLASGFLGEMVLHPGRFHFEPFWPPCPDELYCVPKPPWRPVATFGRNSEGIPKTG